MYTQAPNLSLSENFLHLCRSLHACLLSQVIHKATIEGYTGEGEPPHIEMMITATSDQTTPPDLTVEAKLQGVNEPNIIKLEIEAQNVIQCVYQVFYYKIALNHWRARVAFFPKKHKKVLKLTFRFKFALCTFIY